MKRLKDERNDEWKNKWKDKRMKGMIIERINEMIKGWKD